MRATADRRKRDPGQIETDALLAKIEKSMRREYKMAVGGAQARLLEHFAAFQRKDEQRRLKLQSGEITEKEYRDWRTNQMLTGKRWQEMRDTLARDLHNSNVIARSIAVKHMPDAYAINHNYGTFEVERAARIDTLYTLYDRHTVERLLRDTPELLPPPGRNLKKRIAAGKDIAWQKGQIQSVVTQSILIGESIPDAAKRISSTLGARNYSRAVMYARTAITGAQNAGRRDSYARAEEMGVKLEQEWLAVHDGSTRDSHRALDYERRPVGEQFSNGLEYPGDPSGHPAEVYNCRCSLRAVVEGLEPQARKYRSDAGLEGMTYEEWKAGKRGEGADEV